MTAWLRRQSRPERAATPGRSDTGREAGALGNIHAESVLDVQRSAGVGPDGLTASDAALRLDQHGPNQLPETRARGVLARLGAQFHNVLIYVLLASAVLSLALGHLLDAGVILGVVLLNAAIGFIQEGRAERALNAIRAMIDPHATVLRDGQRRSIAAAEVVPGDLVMLEAGDRVPADLRLLRARSLRLDEAPLTGESVPVDKRTEPVAAEAPLAERLSMAYSGTLVVAGQGMGVAVATGTATELGRISTMVGQVAVLETPLLRQMAGFGRQVTGVILLLSIALLAFAMLVRDIPLREAFMAVVGMAVAAIPEGLPAIMTITLAIGVRRMAARHAIIRQLPAVETLGSVAVICTDKTGTLTRNEMTAVGVLTPQGEYTVSGVGYVPDGVFSQVGRPLDPANHADLLRLARASLLCNDAELRQKGADWQVEGDPMEGALVVLARKAGLDPETERREAGRLDEIPFDSQHRFMATLHAKGAGGHIVFLKGAPEDILALCAYEQGQDGAAPLDREAWRERVEALAAQGQRVLGFAMRTAPGAAPRITLGGMGTDATLLGFVGFMDPPRLEAVAAVRDARAAGIRVIMITGDHAATAREIARQLELDENPTVLSGADLDRMDAAELALALRDVTVFARTTPEHKLRLVMALQAQGLTLAMTGDGVNDAPALKRADVGIAMGRKGTEAAKQAAHMVLADDDFASIVAAVREGRTVFDNIRKVITWTLPTNAGEALTIIAAIVLGFTLPVTPLQILWINMITAVALGTTLAFEPTEPGTMLRPPRRAGEPILTAEIASRIILPALLITTGAFGMFFWAESRSLSIEVARSMVVNTIVVMEIAYLFSVRYVYGSSMTLRGMVGTPAVLVGVGFVIAAQLALTYLPALQRPFETAAIGPWDGMAIIGAGLVSLLLVEMEKRLRLSITARRAGSIGSGQPTLLRHGPA
jgi:magnesium-transporting ATPase (P-type)